MPTYTKQTDRVRFNGARLRELRLERGLTMDDLAAALFHAGASRTVMVRQYIEQWERGSISPQARMVFALAKIFAVSMESLMLDTEDLP